MMTSVDRYADYDAFAWFYNRHWGNLFAERALLVLDQLLLSNLAREARPTTPPCRHSTASTTS